MWAELGPCPARPGSAFPFLTRAFTGKASCPSRKGPAEARRCVWANRPLHPQNLIPSAAFGIAAEGGTLGPGGGQNASTLCSQTHRFAQGPGHLASPPGHILEHGATRSCSPITTAPCPRGRESLEISALRDRKRKQTELGEVERFGAFSALIIVLQPFPCELGHALYQSGCWLCPTGIASWSVQDQEKIKRQQGWNQKLEEMPSPLQPWCCCGWDKQAAGTCCWHWDQPRHRRHGDPILPPAPTPRARGHRGAAGRGPSSSPWGWPSWGRCQGGGDLPRTELEGAWEQPAPLLAIGRGWDPPAWLIWGPASSCPAPRWQGPEAGWRGDNEEQGTCPTQQRVPFPFHPPRHAHTHPLRRTWEAGCPGCVSILLLLFLLPYSQPWAGGAAAGLSPPWAPSPGEALPSSCPGQNGAGEGGSWHPQPHRMQARCTAQGAVTAVPLTPPQHPCSTRGVSPGPHGSRKQLGGGRTNFLETSGNGELWLSWSPGAGAGRRGGGRGAALRAKPSFPYRHAKNNVRPGPLVWETHNLQETPFLGGHLNMR